MCMTSSKFLLLIIKALSSRNLKRARSELLATAATPDNEPDFEERLNFEPRMLCTFFFGRFYIESGYLQCMVEYNVVKFCRFCKNRFVVGKREARRMYCDACEKKVAKMPDN